MMAGWATGNFFFEKGNNEAAWAMVTVYKGAGRICRKIGITVEKVCN